MSTMPYNAGDIRGPEAGPALRHLFLRPEDPDSEARGRRLRELGIGDRANAELDEVARQAVIRLGGRIGGVNLIGENRQFFAGFYAVPSDPVAGPDDEAPRSEDAEPERDMPNEIAYCPIVVARRKALVLEDVRDFARFAMDPVVDLLGVHAYIGAPLMDPSGIALGTLWVVDLSPQRWGREGLAVVKGMAAQLTERIQRGEFRDGGPGPEA
jgi:GAF domain-containing protein